MTKPFCGAIKNWVVVRVGLESVVIGDFERFGYRGGRTSSIVSLNFSNGEVETNNSIYQLAGVGHIYGEPIDLQNKTE